VRVAPRIVARICAVAFSAQGRFGDIPFALASATVTMTHRIYDSDSTERWSWCRRLKRVSLPVLAGSANLLAADVARNNNNLNQESDAQA